MKLVFLAGLLLFVVGIFLMATNIQFAVDTYNKVMSAFGKKNTNIITELPKAKDGISDLLNKVDRTVKESDKDIEEMDELDKKVQNIISDIKEEEKKIDEKMQKRKEVQNIDKEKRVQEKIILHFMPKSNSLDAESKQKLDAIIKSNKDKNVVYSIEGHTDDVGEAGENMELSHLRAEEVAKYIRNSGVDDGRVYTFAYGETKPLVENRGEANRAINRRVEVKVVEGGN